LKKQLPSGNGKAYLNWLPRLNCSMWVSKILSN
jgi:hypothetical protein